MNRNNQSYRNVVSALCIIAYAICVPVLIRAESNSSSDETALPEITPADNPSMFAGYLMDPTTKKTLVWTMENREGLAIVDGDIVLGTVDELSLPGSTKALQYTRQRPWTKGEVPYVLAGDFPKKRQLMQLSRSFIQTRRFDLFHVPISGTIYPLF
jgi:hypothetical protein